MKKIIVYMNPDNNNEIDGGIFKSNLKFPGCLKILYEIPLEVSGKTYQERKNDLEEKAKEWQGSNGEFISWSYGELATIQGFFERNGKRYGLLKEFKENCIC